MLSAARMAQMNRLLDEALDLDPEGRRRWLERLSPEDQDLKPALSEALLPEAVGAESGNLAALPKLGADSETEPASGLQAGELVGPYRLVRPLGAGGMAEVWLASRADGAFKREVALKLPMLSRLRKDLASRFAHERDILAGLEHPNIARLYDAGISPEGLPYLAMEYVHGEPMTAWCDAHRLGIRERLKLFLQVLDAVQYAHGHHVIHRDIKPSNILVTDSGQTRLLDFGVAKLLAHEDEQTELTQIYGRALTPEYASPELVRGEAIDAVADVYSLGVVLYELLAGSRPYRLKAGASITLLEQAIATAQVQRPSTQVGAEAGTERSTTPEKLARRLRGDLDAIVLKALAKAPEDRYRSAETLADDLHQYLSGEPVGARPDSLAYRLTKFVLRHKIAVPLTGALVLLFAAMGYELMRREAVTPPPSATGVAGEQLRTTDQVPVVANDKSIAVLPFLDMSEKHDQEYFSDGLSEELIDHLTRATNLKVIARTSSFSFKGKSEDVRTIASKLGVAHLLEGSVRKAGRDLRITAQLIRASDGTHLWSQTYDRKLDDIFKVQNEIAGAVSQSLNVALNTNADAPHAERNVDAYSLLLKGDFFFQRNAKGDLAQALTLFQEVTRLDPSYALAWVRVGDAYVWLGYWGQISPELARSKGMEAVQRALRIDPKLARAYKVLGNIYRNFDWNWQESRNATAKQIELDPSDLSARLNRGFLTWMQTGNIDEGIEAARRMLIANPLDTRLQSALAGDYYAVERFAEAEAISKKTLELNPDRAFGQAQYAQILLLEGKSAQALPAAEAEPDEAARLNTLACVYWALGRRAESAAALLRLEKNFANLDAYTIATVHAYRGEIDAALDWLDRAYRNRDPGMTWIKFDPMLRSLRKDPRFQALLVRMKLND